MADGRKVHPDCVNAANPYHECFEECYMKITNGKPRKGSSENLGYRPAGYETPKTDPQPQEKRINRACPSASNPYHECGDHCSQKTGEAQRRSMNGKESGSDVVEAPQTMSRRANKDSNPRTVPSVVVNNIRASVPPTTTAPSSPLNFPSKVSEIEELEPEKESLQTKPLSPSVMYSGELRPQEFSFNKAQVKSSYSPPASGTATPVLGVTPDRRTLRDHMKDRFASIASSTPSMDDDDHHDLPRKSISNNVEISQNGVRGSMNGTISDMDRSSEETDEEDDVQSVVSEARVPVGKYQVKLSVSSILRAILEKHGDIAENCLLESVAMRSYYLESICLVVRELQSTSFMNLTKPKVKEMAAVVRDLEASRMNVGWLRAILDKVSEVTEFVSQNQTVKAAKVKCDQGLESTRRKLEFQGEDLSRKEKEVAELKVKVAETRQRLEEVEAEVAQLDGTVASLNSQIDKFAFNTLLQQLL